MGGKVRRIVRANGKKFWDGTIRIEIHQSVFAVMNDGTTEPIGLSVGTVEEYLNKGAWIELPEESATEQP